MLASSVPHSSLYQQTSILLKKKKRACVPKSSSFPLLHEIASSQPPRSYRQSTEVVREKRSSGLLAENFCNVVARLWISHTVKEKRQRFQFWWPTFSSASHAMMEAAVFQVTLGKKWKTFEAAKPTSYLHRTSAYLNSSITCAIHKMLVAGSSFLSSVVEIFPPTTWSRRRGGKLRLRRIC